MGGLCGKGGSGLPGADKFEQLRKKYGDKVVIIMDVIKKFKGTPNASDPAEKKQVEENVQKLGTAEKELDSAYKELEDQHEKEKSEGSQGTFKEVKDGIMETTKKTHQETKKKVDDTMKALPQEIQDQNARN